MEFYKCDICYKTIHKSNKIQGLKDFGGIEKIEIDLCEECYGDLNDYLLRRSEEKVDLETDVNSKNIQMCQKTLLDSVKYFKNTYASGYHVFTCPIKLNSVSFYDSEMIGRSVNILNLICGGCSINL